MHELPSGTVTFLFTDIEGSTRLLHELGDAYADALAEHRRVLRESFSRHGGVEVDTQGDAFFFAFARATDAVAAAREGQRVLAGGPIRVRMGLHTGEPIVTDEGYVGVDVHKGARIAAAGHGGQVLVSQTARDLAGVDDLRDLGEHRLKDLTAPERIFQLGEEAFPPLKTLFGTNLPVQPTPLVGRERELDEASSLLLEHRVLTLLGPGGSGKTRLALQLAADAVEGFPDGVFWVPLQAVGAAELVAPTIARAVGSANGLAEYIGDKRTLVLVDNFEHVLGAAGDLAALVAATPHARLLVTSREPLRIAGEQRYAVEPLPETDAITLFVERARAVDPTFEPDAAVAGICRRLDGLPLALELAAARVNILDTAALSERLEGRLSLLTGGARDAPARQRTLRATIEWSHDLLDTTEQVALRRVAVFAGSFTLEAAEQVGDVSLDTTASLVEKSLVRRWGSGRFGMLDTIQEYARERLAESTEATEIWRRHAQFFLALAESAHLSADTAERRPRHDLAQLEQDNLRAALDWAQANDPVLGLRLAVALEQFWVPAGPHEAIRRLEALLAAATGAPADLHARALRVLGGTTYITGNYERGTDLHRQSLEEFRTLGDELAVGHLLHRLASDALRVGDTELARELTAESGAIHRRFGSKLGEAYNASNLGAIEWAEGNHEAAVALMNKSAAIAAEIGVAWWQTGSLYRLCEYSFELNRLDEAARYGREGLQVAHSIGDRMHCVYLLALLARAAAELGDRKRAGVIWGGLEAEEKRGPVGQWETERPDYAAPVLAHEDAAFNRGRARGLGMSLQEVVEYTVADAQHDSGLVD